MRARRLQAALFIGALIAGISACGGGDDANGPERLTVYVSAPLSGPSREHGRDIADAARLALADAGGEAGGAEVEVEVLDAGAPGAGWSPARAAANARTATRDSTAVAYVGELQSGATRASLPITNKAFMLQVSPASGADDLVAEFPGSDEISALQTNGERTFARVIPSDARQAAAAAAWAAELGEQRLASASDGTEFGDAMAAAFEEAAGGSPGGGGFTFYGGYADGLPERADMASDALLDGGASVSRPLLVTSAALDPSHLPPAGREFAERFAGEYGREPGRYAAYGYEATALVLDAIDRADDPADRQAVVRALFETAARDSVLGRYSITAEGETSLNAMSGYELRGTRVQPVAELAAE